MGDTFFALELQYVLKMVEGRNFKVLTSKQSANFSKFSNQTFNDLELFDQHTRAKEKGSLHLNFRDQDPHFSPKYAQPC